MSWLAPHSGERDPVGPTTTVPGLMIIRDFISEREEERLLQLIDAAEWSNELQRRVQHYGFRYDYRKREITAEDYLGPLPRWAETLGQRLIDIGLFQSMPDQIIVNEYAPGQGISSHIDRPTCFGPTVASISLGSPVIMEYRRLKECVEIPLLPRSMASMTGSARYDWRHSIPPRRSDPGFGERSRRVSLTFRTTQLQ